MKVGSQILLLCSLDEVGHTDWRRGDGGGEMEGHGEDVQVMGGEALIERNCMKLIFWICFIFVGDVLSHR